jgi:Spy/CpxP family protein refolding chaperone
MRLTQSLPVVIALGLCAAPAFADQRPSTPAAAQAKRAERAKKFEARMLEGLKKQGLAEAKAKQVMAVMKQSRAEMKGLRKDTRAARVALKKNPNDAAAKAKLDAAKNKRKAIRAKADAQLDKILTPQEREKVKQFRRSAHQRFKAGKKGARKAPRGA